MNNTKYLPVDVIRAGLKLSIDNINLTGYRAIEGKDYQLHKKVLAASGAVVSLNYNTVYQYFSLKVSLPKLLCGTNATNIPANCATLLISLVNDILVAEGISVDFATFKVSLLELSFNYDCDSVEDKAYLLKHFAGKDVSRKTKCIYGTSVVHQNKTSWTTIYDKSSEMDAHNHLSPDQHQICKILRVEHKLMKRGVKKHFKARTVADILLSDRLEEVFLKENRQASLDLKILHKNLFYKILKNMLENKSYTFQSRVLKFYKELNINGEEYIQKHYSQYKITQYKKIMTSAGYSTTYICKSAHPVDFMSLDKEKKKKLNREEIKEMLSIIRLGKRKSFISKVKEFLSLCFPCTFLKKIFNFFDTS